MVKEYTKTAEETKAYNTALSLMETLQSFFKIYESKGITREELLSCIEPFKQFGFNLEIELEKRGIETPAKSKVITAEINTKAVPEVESPRPLELAPRLSKVPETEVFSEGTVRTRATPEEVRTAITEFEKNGGNWLNHSGSDENNNLPMETPEILEHLKNHGYDMAKAHKSNPSFPERISGLYSLAEATKTFQLVIKSKKVRARRENYKWITTTNITTSALK